MIQLTDVVKHLLIINVLMFMAFMVVLPPQYGSEYTVLHMPWTVQFKPVQLVTHMFMHGSLMHIAFNMMGLVFIGPHIERILGKERFLIFYFLCGFSAMGAHILLAYFGVIDSVSVVGASGAIMGIAIAFAILFPNTKMMLIFPPIPIKAKYLMGALVLYDLFAGIGNMGDGIAHFAHLGGALCGFVLMSMWGHFDARRFR